MLNELKKMVYEANIEIVNNGLVICNWGNVSGIEDGLVAIKPSGVDCRTITYEDIPIVDITTCKVVEGKLKPSSDTLTHIEIYRNFSDIKSIVHTHSPNAVAFAQAGMAIPALGTTHADCFYGDIPCTRELLEDEVKNDYELNTGKVIVECMDKSKVMDIPGILVKSHGPFVWGKSVEKAVYNAVVLEEIAKMALKTLVLNPNCFMPSYILDKHYNRKHGKDAYYGQV